MMMFNLVTMVFCAGVSIGMLSLLWKKRSENRHYCVDFSRFYYR